MRTAALQFCKTKNEKYQGHAVLCFNEVSVDHPSEKLNTPLTLKTNDNLYV